MDDAPCPSVLSTPGSFDKIVDEKDKIMTEIKSFDIDLNNKKYILELAKSENNKNIIFKVSEKKNHKLKYYIAYLDYNQFTNINDFFRVYSNINEIYDLLLVNLNSKNFSFLMKNTSLIITFKFILPNKVLNAEFYLKEEKISNSNMMDDIYDIIDRLEQDNKNMKEEFNKMKNEEKEWKDEINNIKNDNIKLKEEIYFIKNENIKWKDEINSIKNENIKLKDDIYCKDNELKNIKKELDEIKDENNLFKEKLKLLEEKIKNNIYKKKQEKKQLNKYRNDNEEIKSIPNNIPSIDNNNKNYNIIDNKKKMIKNEIINEEEEDEENNKKIDLNKKININYDINKIIDVENYFSSSNIISSKKEKQSLCNWLASKCGQIKDIKLIYQSSIDGDKSEIFFKKCGNVGPTLSVIKSKNNKKFGGFTKENWTDKKGRIKINDEKAFVYSLDKFEKYDVIKPEMAISCIPYEYILVYGNNDDRYGLRIFDEFSEKENYENFGKKAYDVPNQFCLSGDNIFYVEELEVYNIIFE